MEITKREMFDIDISDFNLDEHEQLITLTREEAEELRDELMSQLL